MKYILLLTITCFLLMGCKASDEAYGDPIPETGQVNPSQDIPFQDQNVPDIQGIPYDDMNSISPHVDMTYPNGSSDSFMDSQLAPYSSVDQQIPTVEQQIPTMEQPAQEESSWVDSVGNWFSGVIDWFTPGQDASPNSSSENDVMIPNQTMDGSLSDPNGSTGVDQPIYDSTQPNIESQSNLPNYDVLPDQSLDSQQPNYDISAPMSQPDQMLPTYNENIQQPNLEQMLPTYNENIQQPNIEQEIPNYP